MMGGDVIGNAGGRWRPGHKRRGHVQWGGNTHNNNRRGGLGGTGCVVSITANVANTTADVIADGVVSDNAASVINRQHN